MQNGKGVFKYEEGSSYEGDWKNNQRHGYGTMIWEKKEGGRFQYTGQWKNDMKHGTGKYTWPQDSLYHDG